PRGGSGGLLTVVTSSWHPGRGIRRTVLALAVAGLTLITAGAAIDALWLLGIGVWGVIGAMAVELVYRP
ncbi:hypothetical protein ACFWG6_02900, partial [Streptomyces erythrochromogenes]|uniref:hypothetical protein n=1 Tax=Streptomyces erythrochromogenes TaxID=285574 RepID=UPI003665971E